MMYGRTRRGEARRSVVRRSVVKRSVVRRSVDDVEYRHRVSTTPFSPLSRVA